MKQILVYADSLSWGIIPGTRNRLAFSERWPGVMEHILVGESHDVRVIEDCLNGRRTVLEDPFKPGRKGIDGIGQRIEVNSPLALVMVFLGTNDFQSMHQFTAWESAQGIAAIVNAIRCAPTEPGMPIPEIILVAPPRIQPAKGGISPKFRDAELKAVGLNDAIREIALETGCDFFDAGDVTETSVIDGVHLDKEQHKVLGEALALKVSEWLMRRDSKER